MRRGVVGRRVTWPRYSSRLRQFSCSMSRRGGGAAQPGPSSGAGAQPSDEADLSNSFTLVTPAPGCAAVSDKTFKDFYESLDEFLPTVRPQLTWPFPRGGVAASGAPTC